MSSKKARKEEPAKVPVDERDEEETTEDDEPADETDESEETAEDDEPTDEPAEEEIDRRVAKRAPREEATPSAQPTFSLTTLVAVAALVGAGAFAAGRSMAPSAPEHPVAAEPPGLGGGGGSMGGSMGGGGMGQAPNPNEGLPPGHPPTGDAPPAMAQAAAGPGSGDEPASMAWKVPARWQTVPNPSNMRLATYKVPKAAGDSEDPEVAISQAGGTVDANVQRWIGQFGPEGAKTAKRSTRTVGALKVSLVEVEGTFSGGMAKDGKEATGWAMIGAIVETRGMPHFVKMTGPAKSVKAAKAELDEFLGSVTEKAK